MMSFCELRASSQVTRAWLPAHQTHSCSYHYTGYILVHQSFFKKYYFLVYFDSVFVPIKYKFNSFTQKINYFEIVK